MADRRRVPLTLELIQYSSNVTWVTSLSRRFHCKQSAKCRQNFEFLQLASIASYMVAGACAEKIAGMGPNWKSSEISSAFPCI